MRISDWSSDVCSSDLIAERWQQHRANFWDRTGRPKGADESIDWDGMEQASLDRCFIAMRQRQMVFQGYEWVCPECHHRNWVDMAELRSVLTCTICRHEVDAPITFDWLFKPRTFLIESLGDSSRTEKRRVGKESDS